jgi:hypothetical protein
MSEMRDTRQNLARREIKDCLRLVLVDAQIVFCLPIAILFSPSITIIPFPTYTCISPSIVIMLAFFNIVTSAFATTPPKTHSNFITHRILTVASGAPSADSPTS